MKIEHFITPDFVKERKVEEIEKLNNDRKFQNKEAYPDKKNQEKKDKKIDQSKGTIIDITV